MEVMILQIKHAHSAQRQIPPGAALPVPFHRCARSSQAEHSLRLGRTLSPACSMFVSV
jgi:hypothetical protein